jgi:hypothetical protein
MRASAAAALGALLRDGSRETAFFVSGTVLGLALAATGLFATRPLPALARVTSVLVIVPIRIVLAIACRPLATAMTTVGLHLITMGARAMEVDEPRSLN